MLSKFTRLLYLLINRSMNRSRNRRHSELPATIAHTRVLINNVRHFLHRCSRKTAQRVAEDNLCAVHCKNKYRCATMFAENYRPTNCL